MPLVTLDISSTGVATITLNNPQHRNAMNAEMAETFSATVAKLKKQSGVRSVVLTGSGAAFAAGGDLAMLKEKAKIDPETNAALMLDFYHSFLRMLELPVPLVAAINGHAIGAGFCLALACEARVIAKEAKLGLTFTRLGLHPGMGATCFLPRIAGAATASDLLVSGRVIDAETAYGMGLANRIEPAANVLNRAHEIAASYLHSGPEAVGALLETLRPKPAELEAALVREAAQQSKNYASEEFLEGIMAAIEKRPPVFS